MINVVDILSTMGCQYHGGYHEYCGGYLEYHWGYSVPWGYHDACGGYHEYHGGVQYHRGKSFVI